MITFFKWLARYIFIILISMIICLMFIWAVVLGSLEDIFNKSFRRGKKPS